MKRPSRRRLKRFFQNPLNVLAGVFTILGTLGVILITPARPSSFWPWVALASALIGLARIVLALYRVASIADISYFENISFREPRDRVIELALHGLVNFEKAQPEFVHAAPQSKEVDTLCRTLTEIGFSTIHGGPGEGKSMAAYHAAYRLYTKLGYSPYTLRVDLLADRPFSEFHSDLLEQLDLLPGKRKLIIVDDAQKLAERTEINRLMRGEASEGEIKVIWAETEFYPETADNRRPSDVHIDFGMFVDHLVANLYQRQDMIFQSALHGLVEGLSDAIALVAKNQIRDAWHFAFVASRGEKRIGEEISRLNSADLLALLLISANTVLSGGSDLSTASLMNMLGSMKFGWLTDELKERKIADVVRTLQEYRFERSPDRQPVQRISLVRLYDKTPNDRDYIRSLHYNSAKVIVTAALRRTTIAKDLLESLRVLLVSDYRRCTYIGSLLRSLGTHHVLEFVEANEQWFVGFLSSPFPDTLHSYASALGSLKTWSVESYETIVDKLDVENIAQNVSATEVDGLTGLVDLLGALGHRRHELLKKVAWKDFAPRVASAEVRQFAQIAVLLNALGKWRDDLLGEIVWKDFAPRVASAEVAQFTQVADLLNALGKRRDDLLSEVALKDLVPRVASAEVAQFSQVADLLNAFGKRRDDLLSEVACKDFATRVASAEVTQFT